jgi:5'(3')-deoxyribonucleotidase
MTIKLDIDGVIRDFLGSFHRIYLKVYPQHKDLIKPVSVWGLEEAYPIGKDVYKFMYEDYLDEVFLEADIYDGAIEFVKELKKIGKIHITTFQPVGKEIPTLQWLKKYDIQYDAVSFINDKTQIRGTVLIDDGLHNLIAEAKAGISIPVAINRPWNPEWDGWKFDTYEQILEFVSGLSHGK